MACGASETKETAADHPTLNLNTVNYVKLDFANAEIPMPKSYVRKNLKTLEEEIKNSDATKEEKEEDLKFVHVLMSQPNGRDLYLDTITQGDFIFFTTGIEVYVSKEIANQYLSQLDKEMKQNWSKIGFSANLIEGRYMQSDDYKMVKIKYLINNDIYQKYVTQYIITAKQKTIGLLVSSTHGFDLQELIHHMKLK